MHVGALHRSTNAKLHRHTNNHFNGNSYKVQNNRMFNDLKYFEFTNNDPS